MINCQATIRNKMGIHVRPSTEILGALAGYTGTIKITANGIDADLSGPMAAIGLLSLGLKQGDTLSISVDGPDDVQMADKVKELFEREYDFPPR